MIPNAEKFKKMKCISGTFDDILLKTQKLNVDSLYEDEQALNEVMLMYSCTKEVAEYILKEAKMLMIQKHLDVLIKEGKIIEGGYNQDGDILYKHTETQNYKSKKKK